MPKRNKLLVETIRFQGNMTKNQAYLIGVYLGDGSIASDQRTFTLQAIDKDFVEKTAAALQQNSQNKVRLYTEKRLTKAGRPVYCVSVTDVDLCKWLKQISNHRKNLPIDFLHWPKTMTLELISGLLDSEGYVAVCRWHKSGIHEIFDMKIGIGACDIWIYELHGYFRSIGITVGKITREKLKSGKIFSRFHINKKSFIANGLYFNIDRKQARLEKYKTLFPGSTTIRGIPKTNKSKQKISDFAKQRIRDNNGRFVRNMI